MTIDALNSEVSGPTRDIYIVLGDQLNHDSLLWQDFDPSQDKVWMAEVDAESVAIQSSLNRTLLFFSAMRHFAVELTAKQRSVIYYDIRYTQTQSVNSFDAALIHLITQLRKQKSGPRQLKVVLAGDSRVKTLLEEAAMVMDVPIKWLADNHFLAEPGEFTEWMQGRKSPIMEHWYRKIRKRLGILMESDGKPIGGEWNFDKANRKTFKASGPELTVTPVTFELNEISKQVINDVQHCFNLPGSNALTYWPVNRTQAQAILEDFIANKLPHFGDYQDAMWTEEPWLYHARISSALNQKLLHPAEVCHAAESAYYSGLVPINAVEGFIRQIIGWREYIRGLYWSHHQDWLAMNALGATADLPDFYWHADTPMHCMQQSIKQVIDYGYGHHIQRLMVTGLFALLYGVKPQQIHQWYLAMYIDAIAWVEIPNTLGMSQFADGGIVGTKPYIASGAYINRMSNYCKSCRYDPKQASGPNACPFTALYWQFIDTHQDLLSKNHRLRMQLNNWSRKSAEEQTLIISTAKKIRAKIQKN